jgi:hypothetical protein
MTGRTLLAFHHLVRKLEKDLRGLIRKLGKDLQGLVREQDHAAIETDDAYRLKQFIENEGPVTRTDIHAFFWEP